MARTDKRRSPPLWRSVLGTTGAVILGGVLLVAAVAKALEPGPFVDQIQLEKLDFFFSAGTVALIALALETGLGIALLLGTRHLLVLIPTSALVLFFLFLTGQNYWLVSRGLRQESVSCGCFGSWIDRTPAEAFWQDLLLLIPPLLLAFWARSKTRHALPRGRLGLALGGALVLVFFTWRSPDLRFSGAAAQIASAQRDDAFRPNPSYRVTVDGLESKDSRVYESPGVAGLLVASPDLPAWLLIDPRTRKFHRLERSEVSSTDDSLVQIPEQKSFPLWGEFDIEAGGITFEVEGRRFRLESGASGG